MTAARSRAAKVHSTRAHYCACGFVGFGNGAEWSHERKHTSGVIPMSLLRWVTREQWQALGYRR